MSKRERIARLTADLIERQGQYRARINTLSQTKREILREVSGSLYRGNDPFPPTERVVYGRDQAGNTGSSRPHGGWSVRTSPQVIVEVDGSFEG